MYEAFFGLREKPFNLTPDPRFLFLSEKHKEAFAHLLYGIKNRGGFVMVTGEIGTGKTTICRTLLGKLEDDTEVAFIFNPCMSPEELLRTINEDFGIHSRAGSIKGLIDELNTYLLDRKTRGKNCVIVIDEAQNLTPQVLEQIRLLSNLETEQEKLLQIVLIGQPELAEHLELHELRQLDQRITARYHLRELDREETLQYIAYRLRVAGGRGRIRFTRGAVRAVYRFSGGVPRMINAICDRALLVGYTQESRDVTSAIVRRAAREVRGERLGKPARRTFSRVLKPLMAAAVLALILGGGYLSFPYIERQWAEFKQVQASKVDSAPAPLSHDKAASPSSEKATPISPAVSVDAPAAPQTTPAASPPPPSADVVASSETVLENLEPVAARDAAAGAILAMWGITPQGKIRSNDIQGLTDYFAANGLNAESLSPTLNQLLAIDLPALTTVLGKDFQPMWVGIVGRQGENVVIATAPDQTAVITKAAFEKRYTIQAVVPWHDGNPVKEVLQETMQGDSVAALQARLATIGRLSGSPTGVYDAATVTAVRLVQHETGLTVDGKVGRQTRMVLNSWDDSIAAPSLKAGPPPPTPKPTEEVQQAETTETVVASAPAPSEVTPDKDPVSADEPVEEKETKPVPEASVAPEQSPVTKEASSPKVDEAPAEPKAPAAEEAVTAKAPEEAAKPEPDAAGKAPETSNVPVPSDTTVAQAQPEAAPAPNTASPASEPVADPEAEPVPTPQEAEQSVSAQTSPVASTGGTLFASQAPALNLEGFDFLDMMPRMNHPAAGSFIMRDASSSAAMGQAKTEPAGGAPVVSE